MRKCQECQHENREGTLVCDDCGFPLIKIVTTALANNDDAAGMSPALSLLDVDEQEYDVSPVGTMILSEGSDVLIEFVGFHDRLPIVPNHRTVLGRADQNAESAPDIDLTPYGAFEKGVSRIHAALIRQEASLTLLDLGSSNGTLINGRRIAANQPRVVQDGDEITFGQLVARIYFK